MYLVDLKLVSRYQSLSWSQDLGATLLNTLVVFLFINCWNSMQEKPTGISPELSWWLQLKMAVVMTSPIHTMSGFVRHVLALFYSKSTRTQRLDILCTNACLKEWWDWTLNRITVDMKALIVPRHLCYNSRAENSHNALLQITSTSL